MYFGIVIVRRDNCKDFLFCCILGKVGTKRDDANLFAGFLLVTDVCLGVFAFSNEDDGQARDLVETLLEGGYFLFEFLANGFCDGFAIDEVCMRDAMWYFESDLSGTGKINIEHTCRH